MKLYLIRHGESENNKNGCFTGWTDANLTEKGYEDARGVRKYISDIKFDKIYSSDLKRAKKTAETTLPGCVYEETPLIRERNFGKLEGNKISLVPELFGEDYIKSREMENYKLYDGEDDEEFSGRVIAFLNTVKDGGYENVAAFCHGGVLRKCAEYVLQAKNTRGTIICRNCVIEILEYNGEKWHLHSWINTQ